MKQDKEDALFIKRMTELAGHAYQWGVCLYSDFLNLNEMDLFYKNTEFFSCPSYTMWGGYEEAERRVVCFCGDDSFHDTVFPVCCLKISRRHEKYGELLSHRDYLGAILNLGIDRKKTGDILVHEKDAYLFCMEEIAAFICENLEKVKHTDIRTNIVAFSETGIHPRAEEIISTVSSIRLDSIAAAALHTSRSSVTGLIQGKKVYINGRLLVSNSFVPKEGDILSIRGYGRFVFQEVQNKTKKDRYKVVILKYI